MSSRETFLAIATQTAPGVDAARELFERHRAALYRYALSQLRSREDAEDAVQNTFLRAFRALERGVVPENETAWLFKIAHNVCLSSKLAWLRRRRVETPRDLELLAVSPTAPESRRDELVGLEDALAALPPRLREALLLREWQGLSYAEIAERLDTSVSAIETLIFRARRKLAEQLEQPLQRVRSALGLGPLLDTVRGLLGGGSAALKAAGIVAVVAGATVAAAPLYAPAHHHAARTPAPVAVLHVVAPALAASGRHGTARPAGTHRTARRGGVATGSAGGAAAPAAVTGAAVPASTPAPTAPPAGPSTPGVSAPTSPAGSATPRPTTGLPTTTTVVQSVPVPSTTLPGTTVPALTTPSLPPAPQLPGLTTPSLPPPPAPTVSTPSVAVPTVTTSLP